MDFGLMVVVALQEGFQRADRAPVGTSAPNGDVGVGQCLSPAVPAIARDARATTMRITEPAVCGSD